MNLSSVPTNELLRRAYAEIDLLTSTDLERELLRRLEASEENMREAEGFLALVHEYDLTSEETRSIIEAHPSSSKVLAELLSMLSDRGITDADDLKALIKRVDDFRSLANDAGDLFSRLHTLIEETQED